MKLLGIDGFEKDQWGCWRTKYDIKGIPFQANLELHLDENESEPDQLMADSFKMLDSKQEVFVASLLTAVVEVYEDDLPNSRAIAPEYGNDPDKVAPILNKPTDIWPLIRYLDINLMSHKHSGFDKPIFEVVFGCTWEPEKRFNVYYENGQLGELD